MGDFVKAFTRGQLVSSVLLAWFLPTAIALASVLFALNAQLQESDLQQLLRSAEHWSGLSQLVLFLIASVFTASMASLVFPLVGRYLRHGSSHRLAVGFCARQVKRQAAWMLVLSAREKLAEINFVDDTARREWAELEADSQAKLNGLRRLPAVSRGIRERPLFGLEDLADYPPVTTAYLRNLLSFTDNRNLMRHTRIAPFGAGNLMRRGQRLSIELFGIDPYVVWYELRAHTSESLLDDARRAREDVEFSAAFVAGGFVMASTSLMVLVSAPLSWLEVDASVIGTLIAGCMVSIAGHRRLLSALRENAALLQAIVSTNRSAVAEDFGISLPADLAEERQIWSIVMASLRSPRKVHRQVLSKSRIENHLDMSKRD